MGFNKTSFIKQKFEHRTEVVPVPALAEWFDKDTTPEWTVRNLSGAELASTQETVNKNKNVSALTEALVSSNQPEKVQALRKLIGTSDDVPGELAKRLEMLVHGSVEPTIDLPIAIKIAEHFPVEFMSLTNKITILTGMGSSMVKPRHSGTTPQSEGASH